MTGRGIAAALVLVLTVGLATLGGSAAARSGTADQPWVGYRIDKNKYAWSGWIGARTLADGRKVYRVDPTRTRTTSRFEAPVWRARFNASGRKRVTRGQTACAALLLGKYGTRRDRLQLAGVDLAIYHLLHGGKFRYDGDGTVRRTDQREDGPLIRAYAQNLVQDYCDLAGPYEVRLTSSATAVDVGDTITYTVRVRSRADVAMAGIPLTVTTARGELTLETDDQGSATFTTTPSRSGPSTVSVVTHRLPHTKVRVFQPRRDGASRVVQAGLKQKSGYPRTSTVPVKGLPRLDLGALDDPVRVGEEFRSRFRLSDNYPVRRTATVRLYGPFRSRDNADCIADKRVRGDERSVEDSGWYDARRMSVRRSGIYVWRVRVEGDPLYNEPVERCGRKFEVD